MPITAIIPALNEEISIGSVVLKTKKHVDHVIVIDDGSTDNTAEIARLAGADVVRHNKNRGKGEALKTGFGMARNNGTKIIVTIDADGQHDPGEIPKVIEPILSKEADMVIGNRHNIHGTDSSGFRAFAIHTIQNFRFSQKGFSIEREMLTDAENAGLKIKEIDIGIIDIDYKKKILKTKNGTKIIVALPAHNEENYIAKVVLGCKELVDEVIVVDDGSSDATVDIARSLGAIVIKHETNKGYGAAINTCFKTAKERNADVMIILDSDGQHNPGDIVKFIEPINNGVDIVIGSRFISSDVNNAPTYRKLGMRLLDHITIFAGSEKTSDSQSGFRAYSRRAIEQINIKGDGMSVGSEILLHAKEKNLKISEVPITCRYDQGGSSQNPISHGMNVVTGICETVVYKRPLLYFVSIGTTFLIFGSGVGLWSIDRYIGTNHLPFGPSIATLLFLMLGSLSIFSGLILHSLRRIIKEIKI